MYIPFSDQVRYHAHSSVHLADGLYGGIVVHKPADSSEFLQGQAEDYDAEQLLLIGDWYHRKAKSVLDWYEDTQHFAFDVSRLLYIALSLFRAARMT